MLTLTAPQRNAIRCAVEAVYPAEGCGLLVGDASGKITRVEAAPNILAEEGRDCFEVDPAVRIRLEKELRGTGEHLLGHFHSHPDVPARPSATDIAKAYEPDLIWLIASVHSGRMTELKAFRIVDGTVTELEIASDG